MKSYNHLIVPPTLSISFLYNRYYKKLFNIITSVFEWNNLPETFDEDYLTSTLITNGNIGIINTPNGLISVRGNVGGAINEYYKPTQYIYANPILGSGNPTINKDCAVIFLTSFDTIPTEISRGLSSLIETTAMLLAENILSLHIAQKNTRLIAFVNADNEATANSAEQMINSMYNGRPFKVISKSIADTIEVNPIANTPSISQNMKQLIENQQYIIAQFMQEVGINANFNMKRERLTTSEVDLNADCLDTLIDNIEKTVNDGLKVCNKLYNTNISLTMKRYGEQEEIEDFALTQKSDSTKGVNDSE